MQWIDQILHLFLVIVFVKFIAFSALVLVTSGRTLIGSLVAESSSEVIDMLNPSKKCNASSLPSARFWAKGKVFIDKFRSEVSLIKDSYRNGRNTASLQF